MSYSSSKFRGRPLKSAPPFDKPSRMRVIGKVKPVGYSLFDCPSPLVSRQNRHFSKVSPLKSFADVLISDSIANLAAKEALRSDSNKEALMSSKVPFLSLNSGQFETDATLENRNALVLIRPPGVTDKEALESNEVRLLSPKPVHADVVPTHEARTAPVLSLSPGTENKAAPVSEKVCLLSPKLGHTGAVVPVVVDVPGTSFTPPNPFPDDFIRDIESSETQFGNVDELVVEGSAGDANLSSKADPNISSFPGGLSNVVFGSFEPVNVTSCGSLRAGMSQLGAHRCSSKPRVSAAEKGKGPLVSAINPSVHNPPSLPRNLPKSHLKYVGYKLQFDHDGQDLVYVDDEDILSVEEAWGYSLLGFFVGNTPSWRDIKIMQDRWSVRSVLSKEKGWLVFSFNSAQDRDVVLFQGPYFADRRLLVLKPVPNFFNFDKDDLSSIPTWIKLSNLPAQFWTPGTLAKLGSRIGNPLFVDPVTESREKKAFARLLVELDCKKDNPATVSLALKDGSKRVISVEYESLPFYCSKCNFFGHDLLHCKRAARFRQNANNKIGRQEWRPKAQQNPVISVNRSSPSFSGSEPNPQESLPKPNQSYTDPPLQDLVAPPPLDQVVQSLSAASQTEVVPLFPYHLSSFPPVVDSSHHMSDFAGQTNTFLSLPAPVYLVDLEGNVFISGKELALPTQPVLHVSRDVQLVRMQNREFPSPGPNLITVLSDSSSASLSLPSQCSDDTLSDASSSWGELPLKEVGCSIQQKSRRSSRAHKPRLMMSDQPSYSPRAFPKTSIVSSPQFKCTSAKRQNKVVVLALRNSWDPGNIIQIKRHRNAHGQFAAKKKDGGRPPPTQ